MGGHDQGSAGQARLKGLVARIVVSGGLLAALFVLPPLPGPLGRFLPHRIPFAAILDDLAHASPWWLILANALTAPIIVLVSWKWQILLRAAGVNESLWRLVRMNLIGGFYSLVLPGEETGQLAKGVILARHSKGDAVAASIIVDEILGTLSVFSIALVALAITADFSFRPFIAAALAVMLAVFLALLVLAIVPRFHGLAQTILERGLPLLSAVVVFVITPWPVRRLVPRARQALVGRLEGTRTRFIAWLQPFWSRLAGYHHQPGPLAAAFLITVAAHLVADVSVLSTMNSVDAGVSFVDVCWIFAAISALVTIPITVSGFGVRETANVMILGPLGVSQGKAAAISLLAFAIGLVWSLPGALLQFGIKWKGPDLPPAGSGEASAGGAGAGNAAS